MTVHCGTCGTELLGAVNRCWKCGQQVVSTSDDTDLPPVRRPPVAGPLDVLPWEALTAVVVDDLLEVDPAATVGAKVSATETGTVRRGSPFEAGARLSREAVSWANRWTSVRAKLGRFKSWLRRAVASPTQSPAPVIAAVMAIGLAGGSLSFRDYPEAAVALALLGLLMALGSLAMGVRALSIVATVVCVFALLWSVYSTAIVWYERRYGATPWSEEAPDDFSTEPLP